jgi:hypothetical protein
MSLNEYIFDKIKQRIIDQDFDNRVWPNIESESDKTSVRVNPIPMPTQGLGLSTTDIFAGICQVDCVVKSGTGHPEAARLADEICELFPRNLRIAGDPAILFDKPAWASPAVNTGNEYFIPVNVEYKVIRS